MEYYTYWSVLDTPSKSIESNSICLYIAIGLAIIWFLIKRFKKDKAGDDKIILLWGTGAFSILALFGYFMLTYISQDKTIERTIEMLNSPKTPKVEGAVSKFKRTSRNGKENIVIFTVDSVQFAYGDAALGKFSSFTQTKNDVIFNGQIVRITYSSGSYYGDYNTILKIEIAK